ncbi:hypothetical protein RhiirA5_420855 [Rhizophagus irregularis]|uniref:Uncharacterized protein n=1 Tax=Rhizophagus irregularis TaxID=588596 RepID=A0A2I1EWZ7_9GLOM|nr:hypothetical protein RhiirA5_420855 [Rhizophagus irregularis]PKC61477.1 hypothetical protein RhiirA1_466499 [Rhizophagus irregularis]PKY26638.1 hypothetical protein RhiirB3_442022 [Rhizophagus irregularis]CAB4481037.1 unnamed protein product [Rhizophagus irregularis]CAB5179707.1 unnamed protein product [Rhizophagus irregularis]
MTDYYTMKSLKYNELQKNNIKVRKNESEVYMNDKVCDQKTDLLISNIGCLGDTLKSAFELVDKQAEITIEILDHMKCQEARLSELESQKVRMDRIEARLYQMNKADFLSDSRDWVGMFMTNLAGKYGERELFDAETVLEKEMDLTDHEIKSIQSYIIIY